MLDEYYHADIGNINVDLYAATANTYKTIPCQLHFVLQRSE
jgi:hypothetical protein